jgi:hypothetical protein
MLFQIQFPHMVVIRNFGSCQGKPKLTRGVDYRADDCFYRVFQANAFIGFGRAPPFQTGHPETPGPHPAATGGSVKPMLAFLRIGGTMDTW